MKHIYNYIIEALHINKNTTSKTYSFFPKNKNELIQIIINKFNEQLVEQKDKEDNSVITLNDIDVSDIKDFSELFYKVYNNIAYSYKKIIKVIDISEWEMSQATDLSYMFKKCEYVEEIKLSDWNVTNVRKFIGVFSLCEKLKTLDLSNWKTLSAQNMKYMFNECESLETIGDISKWYIKQVLDFNHMFKRCSKLSCNISSWKFNKKARISNMNDSAEGVKLPS